MIKKIFYSVLISLILVIYTKESHAISVKIISFVDNEIITNIDIKKEVEYLKILNPNLNQLEEQKIIELSKLSLIDEKVKKIEISKFIDLENLNNNFLNDYLKNLYERLGYQNQKQFVNNLNEKNTYLIEELKRKINIELFWNELIFTRFNELIEINENELRKKIRDKKKILRKEYNLSEIVFQKKKDIDLNEQIKLIKLSINDIGFENSANIFSVSQTSKFGGLIGWVDENSLSKKILNSLNSLDNNEITEVLNIGNNYLILKINKIRKVETQLNEENELKKLIEFERNKELRKYSKIYFDKTKINILIREN